MRVCFFSHSAGRGGAGIALLETVSTLIQEGAEGLVVLPAGGPLRRQLSERGIRCAVVPYTWWMSSGASWWKRGVKTAVNAAAAAPLAALLRIWRCDVACSNSLTICVGAWAARLARIPHVWFIHEYGREHHDLTFDLGEDRARRQIAALSAAIVAPSRAVAERYRNMADTTVHVLDQIVEGPPTEPPAPPSGDELRCTMVGALQPRKAQDEAIRAVAMLTGRGVTVRLTIVGAGSTAEEARLRGLARDCGVSDRVVFAGFVDDPLPHLMHAHVAIVCSRWEAFGRTTVEAMLCGRPVVAARSGATPELVRHGFNGLLYEPGDVEDLTGAIMQLAADRCAAAAMGRRGREWARSRFTRAQHGVAVRRILQTAAGSAA